MTDSQPIHSLYMSDTWCRGFWVIRREAVCEGVRKREAAIDGEGNDKKPLANSTNCMKKCLGKQQVLLHGDKCLVSCVKCGTGFIREGFRVLTKLSYCGGMLFPAMFNMKGEKMSQRERRGRRSGRRPHSHMKYSD